MLDYRLRIPISKGLGREGAGGKLLYVGIRVSKTVINSGAKTVRIVQSKAI